MLGYKTVQGGQEAVVVFHDWFCDTNSYASIKPYLGKEFTYYFVDVRGYGQSKHLEGSYTVEEIYADLVALVDHLNLPKFHLVTHSMTGLVAQLACKRLSHRLLSVMATTPTPACGNPGMIANLPFFEGATAHDRDAARMIVGFMTSQRYTQEFVDHKVDTWWACSTPQARLGYLHMFVKSNLVDEVKGCNTPLLVLTGAHDVDGHTFKDMEATIGQWFSQARFVDLPSTGHYPMQEIPPLFTKTLMDHLRAHTP